MEKEVKILLVGDEPGLTALSVVKAIENTKEDIVIVNAGLKDDFRVEDLEPPRSITIEVKPPPLVISEIITEPIQLTPLNYINGKRLPRKNRKKQRR